VSSQSIIASLAEENKRLDKIIRRLSEIIDSSGVDTRRCGDCGWIDYSDKIQEYHQGSDFRICDSCVCTCTESDKDEEENISSEPVTEISVQAAAHLE
jgi:hypothetical protein